MHVQEINSKYIFTDGEIISFKVNYRVPVKGGFIASARVSVKARHALGDEAFEYCTLILNFSGIRSLNISEDFTSEAKISDMTLKKLDDGSFYISLHPFNTTNEPNENDNFVIKADGFTFDMER